jgi:C1A family cysteine protease
MFNLKNIFNPKKMKNKNGVKSRKIDESVEKTSESLSSQFALVSKMKIKAWKGYLALFFVAGLATAIIFSVQTNIQTKSSAKSTRAEELEQIKQAIKDKGAKWEAADNPIFQLSDEDRKKRVNLKKEEKIEAASYTTDTNPTAEVATLSASLDWRNNGGNFVTPIKNQGNCGSCWAFAMTAGLESDNLIAKNQPNTNLDLSEQVMVSCSGYGSCSGGSVYPAYVRDTGLPTESCYPYTATNGVCTNACANWQASAYKIGNFYSVPRTINDIKTALATYGPLTTTFSVYADFFSYRTGVYTYTSGTYQGSHAVLIVGYDDPGQYLIVKNSWGTGWGEAGFFRIAYSEVSGGSTGFGSGTYAFSNTPPEVTSITVGSPNGGESWDAGGLTNRAITWNFLGDSTAYVKIELLKAGSVVSTISSSTSIANKNYNWQIPANLAPGTDYKIRITSTGNGVTDSSNSDFTIAAPIPPSLSLVSPNGGEAWKTKSTQIIKWSLTGNPGSSLKIELLKAGTVSQTITSGANTSTGSYTWKIPVSQPIGTDYQIRITSNTNSSYTDMSNGNFSVTSAAPGKNK